MCLHVEGEKFHSTLNKINFIHDFGEEFEISYNNCETKQIDSKVEINWMGRTTLMNIKLSLVLLQSKQITTIFKAVLKRMA